MNKSATYYNESDLPHDENPWLDENTSDFLYHLGFDKNGKCNGKSVLNGKSIQEFFGDVTHVCMGGSSERAQRFADTLHQEKYPESERTPIESIGKTDRFSLYKVGNVISVSHGMGMPSMSILLHEISKMLYYAKGHDIARLRDEVSFIRIGTSGGVGVEGGTVVVAENAMNPMGKHEHEEIILGDKHIYPTHLNRSLSGKILAANVVDEVGKEINIVLGDTVGTDDFYEGQGRVDGFFDPGYSEEDKLQYLQELRDLGVRNFEMESTCFASFCLRAGIPGAIVCVALLNRLDGDQVTADLDEISENAEKIVLNLLRKEKAI